MIIYIMTLLLFSGCINLESDKLSDQEINELETVISNLISLESGQQIDVQYKAQGIKSGLIEVNFTIRAGGLSNDISVYLTKDKKYIAFIQDYNQLKANFLQSSQNQNRKISKISDPAFLDKKQPLGNKNAKIIIIEFSDYECPFCARFEFQTAPSIKSNWINTGKAVMYYAHYPLPFHPKAEPAALASYCAEQQGKFWEYSDLIFKNINTLNNKQDYIKLAEGLNLDLTRFESCLDTTNPKFYMEEMNYGSSIGITGTPGFLVLVDKSISAEKLQRAAQAVQGTIVETDNKYGIVFSGAYPYNIFESMLNELYN